MKNKLILIFALAGLCIPSKGQNLVDSTLTKNLEPVTIEMLSKKNNFTQLQAIEGTYIIAGKKNEVIQLKNLDANLAEKTGRQIFAKIPGIFVYDMDGAGNQINIAARGLDPHRGWEFNIRKDGVLTNSDMYGYPASHYSMPLESIEKIELVRGTGSLQYGAQFGGMLNYVSKMGDTLKSIGFESYNTIGSYNLISFYHALGGRIGKIKYYAYYAKRSRDGFRKNEHTDYDAESIKLEYNPIRRLSFTLDWSRSNYIYKIPGPLTDDMFSADPTQSTRSRNYFNPAINIPSFNCNWSISTRTKLQIISSAVLGARNSVLFDKPATIKDSINVLTGQYNNRQVDIDLFRSYTNELRILQNYRLGHLESNLTFGAQYMNNDLHRRQQGLGTTGTDYDLSLVKPRWGRDIHFKTKNIALFAENSFKIFKDLTANIGFRMESGESRMSGSIVYYPTEKIPVLISHQFSLLGGSFSYKPLEFVEFYGGFSQAYRPMIFKDLVPIDAYERVDPNIKDAHGYNAEFGCRGNWKFLHWDLTGFALQYKNRFGNLVKFETDGSFYTYRTNIGNSFTKGLEMLVQGRWMLDHKVELSLFSSTAVMDAVYTSGVVKSGNNNIEIKGNKIESAPELVSRNGLQIRYNKISFSALVSYTGESFADALNTVTPSANGAVGLVPSYTLIDLNASYIFCKNFEIKASLNNLANKQYFTKRPLFYPGPGVWPSDGRNGTVSIIIRM